MIYAVFNATRNISLGRQIVLANSSDERRTGLLKRDSLAEGCGLWINPCEAVHTFFMRFSIDVIFLDKQNRVRKVRAELNPWRMSALLDRAIGAGASRGNCGANAHRAGGSIGV